MLSTTPLHSLAAGTELQSHVGSEAGSHGNVPALEEVDIKKTTKKLPLQTPLL